MNFIKFRYYLKIWWMLTKNSFTSILSQRIALAFFLFGKLFRFIFFIIFLYYLINGTGGLMGYSSLHVIFFFLTFNVVDVLSQFLFREVYRFRPKIISGDFDLTLVKPINSLFMSLMGGADLIDFITIPPLLLSLFYIALKLDPTIFQVVVFLALLLNGLVLATAFHILVLGMAIITLEIDHTIMIYRDVTSFGRFPVDIYKQPLQGLLTYLFPVGLMMTLPAKALVGIVTWQSVVASLLIGVFAFLMSLRFWNFSLKRYTSASS